MLNELKLYDFTIPAPITVLFLVVLAATPFNNTVAGGKASTRSIESKELNAWFIDKLCTSIKRGRLSGKRFRNEEYLVRYCGEYKSLPPPRLIPHVIVAEFPEDSNYEVRPGLLACDVVSGEGNTCGVFADVCMTGLNGTGWCEQNEEGGDGTCYCEYDPDSLD